MKSILSRFFFTIQDITHSANNYEGEDNVFTGIDIVDPTTLKIGAAIASGAAMVIVETMMGGLTFGALTVVAILFGYFSATAYEYKYEKGSTRLSVRASGAVVNLLAGLGISLANDIKFRGRAIPQANKVLVKFKKDALPSGSKLAQRIVEATGKSKKVGDLEVFKSHVLELISEGTAWEA